MARQFRVRLFFVLFALAMIAVPMAVTYTTSYTIDELQRDKLALEAAVEAERNAIRVLQAEWAYLAEPARIERLTTAHLKMNKAGSTQIALAKDMDKLDAKPVMVATATRTERLPLPLRERVGVRGNIHPASSPSPAETNDLLTQAKVSQSSPARGEVATATPENVQLLLAGFRQ